MREKNLRKHLGKHLGKVFGISASFMLAGAALACESVIDKKVRGIVPESPEPEHFNADVFRPVGKTVKRETINVNQMGRKGVNEIRDAMIAARLAYSDYSELLAKGALAYGGWVYDLDLFYQLARKQIFMPLQSENWSASEVAWARQRFDILYVNEVNEKGLNSIYQGNIALLQHKASGVYYIGLGGTNSVEDLLTSYRRIYQSDQRARTSEIVDTYFEKIIPKGATVYLAGHSLGAAEAVLHYRQNPNRFAKVYAIQALGLGGRNGTYYSLYRDEGKGDAKIIEIIGDDKGEDSNDMIVSWGNIGAGRIYCIDNVVNIGESEFFGRDLEMVDAHFLGNMWATLPK